MTPSIPHHLEACDISVSLLHSQEPVVWGCKPAVLAPDLCCLARTPQPSMLVLTRDVACGLDFLLHGSGPGACSRADLVPVLCMLPACVDGGVCAQLELILTAATLCIAIVGVISGLFGMNLHNTHEDSYFTFVMVNFPITVTMQQIYAYIDLHFQSVLEYGCTIGT